MGGDGQGDVPVPSVVAADLVVVEPDLALGGLETLLDRPAATGDGDELLLGRIGGAVAQVVGQVGGTAPALFFYVRLIMVC